MDLFVHKNDSLKAGNISGVKVKTTTIDYENETITHYVENQVRDGEGDPIGVTGTYAIIELTHDEFLYWVNQNVINAVTTRVDSTINTPS